MPTMSLLSILALAVALGMDAFAVAAAAGLALPRVTRRHVFRLAWHFGLFQFLMPIVGWLAGTTVSPHISAYDHWVAFGLLAFVGGKMLRDAFSKKEKRRMSDPTRGLMLIVLSVATSIDALAVGLSMGFLQVSVWTPAVIIGVVAAVLTVIGIQFGSRLAASPTGSLRGWRRWAEIAGGVILLLIGFRILVSHLVE